MYVCRYVTTYIYTGVLMYIYIYTYLSISMHQMYEIAAKKLMKNTVAIHPASSIGQVVPALARRR